MRYAHTLTLRVHRLTQILNNFNCVNPFKSVYCRRQSVLLKNLGEKIYGE